MDTTDRRGPLSDVYTRVCSCMCKAEGVIVEFAAKVSFINYNLLS